MSSPIRIGTRGSKLALWQAEHVAKLMQQHGITTEIITIDTKGDKILDVSIAKIGSKGVFTEEIEDQLLKGNIDIAVHSAKDMQSTLPDGFELLAFTERETVNDVWVSDHELPTDKPIRIGTSSTRRVAQLGFHLPEMKTVPVRGNLQTRIKRMREGTCDVLQLAYAGVYRMGYGSMIVKTLDTAQFTPAVGQGSVAVECHVNLDSDKKELIRNAVNHESTAIRLSAERAFLKKMDGGCSIPVFGLADLSRDKLKVHGGIVKLNGSKIIENVVEGKPEQAEELGAKLADLILGAGGDAILKEIKNQLKS